MFIDSLILGSIEDGFSFSTHSVASFPSILIPFKHLFFGLIFNIWLCEEKLFFIRDIRRRCCHLYWCCLYIFPHFETYLLRSFKILSGEKLSCRAGWINNVRYFEIELQHIITCVPQRWWNGSRLEKKHVTFCYPSRCLLAWLLPQSACKIEKCPVFCRKLFWVTWHFELGRWDDVWYVYRFNWFFWSVLSSIMSA